jgi:hypothetical protein
MVFHKSGGRTKGSKNARTLELELILKENNHCPIRTLLADRKLALQRYEDAEEVNDQVRFLSIAVEANKELIGYVYPKRTAVAHSVSDEDLAKLDMIKEFEALPTEVLKRIEEGEEVELAETSSSIRPSEQGSESI